MPRRMLAPNLGVTAMLATLWSVAAISGGIDGAAARALDPAVDGSLADVWALLQLATLLLVALSVAAPWPLVMRRAYSCSARRGGCISTPRHCSQTPMMSPILSRRQRQRVFLSWPPWVRLLGRAADSSILVRYLLSAPWACVG